MDLGPSSMLRYLDLLGELRKNPSVPTRRPTSHPFLGCPTFMVKAAENPQADIGQIQTVWHEPTGTDRTNQDGLFGRKVLLVDPYLGPNMEL